MNRRSFMGLLAAAPLDLKAAPMLPTYAEWVAMGKQVQTLNSQGMQIEPPIYHPDKNYADHRETLHVGSRVGPGGRTDFLFAMLYSEFSCVVVG